MTDWASEKARELVDGLYGPMGTVYELERLPMYIEAALREAERRVHEEYRAVYGCRACGEQHPEYVICPPHEVRTTGRASVNQLVARARVDAERRMQERAELRLLQLRDQFPPNNTKWVVLDEAAENIRALIPGEG